MLAYHNDASNKSAILAKLAHHRAADELVKGQYWENGKGCAVGCTIESGNHAEYEGRFGIPRVLARLEDRIFEGLPNDKAKEWPERFMGAIQPGSDLTMVWPRLALWMLSEELPQRVSSKYPKTTAALAAVAALYREWVETDTKPTIDRWQEARQQARAAYAAAYAVADAYAAAYAAAVAVADAYAAADAAAVAAAYAAAVAVADAYAAADAARRRIFNEAMETYYVRLSNKLVELLEAA